MEYKIVSATELDTLVELVNREFQNGWVLQGGMMALAIPELGTFVYHQAMRKNEQAQARDSLDSSACGCWDSSDGKFHIICSKHMDVTDGCAQD